MPIISIFYGITVSMYFGDHPPPHIHVDYHGHEALVRIADAEIIRGKLPPVARRLSGNGSPCIAMRSRPISTEYKTTTTLSRFLGSTMTLIKVRTVKPLGEHRLWFEFSDGSQGERDFAELVRKDRSILEPLRDPAYFARVFLQRGAPTWPNGFDLAPWALYDEMERDKTLVRPPHAA